MLNNTAPPFADLSLNRFTSLDVRDHVRVVVRLKQRKAVYIVESAIREDGLGINVKIVKHNEKLSEDVAGSVAVFETAYCRRVTFVRHMCAKRGGGVQRGGSALCHRAIEAVCVSFVIVVRSAGGGRLPPARGGVYTDSSKEACQRLIRTVPVRNSSEGGRGSCSQRVRSGSKHTV